MFGAKAQRGEAILSPGDANRSELESVVRAILTFAIVLAGMAVVAFVLPNQGAWIIWFLLAFSLTALPLAALLCAAPAFRFKQYILNGCFVALAFPITAYLWFDADGIDDPGPQALFVLILFSGPSLLSLAVTALAWAPIWPWRQFKAPRTVGTVSRAADDREELWLAARGLLAVARAALTSVTLIALLGMLFFEGAHLDGEPEVWAAVAASAVTFPLAALLFAAPGFRMPEYLLNGGFALFAVPIFIPLLYKLDGVDGLLTSQPGIVTALSGPALLTLMASTLALAAIRRPRDRDQAGGVEPRRPEARWLGRPKR